MIVGEERERGKACGIQYAKHKLITHNGAVTSKSKLNQIYQEKVLGKTESGEKDNPFGLEAKAGVEQSVGQDDKSSNSEKTSVSKRFENTKTITVGAALPDGGLHFLREGC